MAGAISKSANRLSRPSCRNNGLDTGCNPKEERPRCVACKRSDSLNRVESVVTSTTVVEWNVFGLLKRRSRVVEHRHSISAPTQSSQPAKRASGLALHVFASMTVKAIWLAAQAIWEAWRQ
jgi:hypothetical protein